MHHIVVISDIHLCQLEPGEDLWMRYRQRACSPDRAIASMIDALLAEITSGGASPTRTPQNPEDSGPPAASERPRLTLALNGDIFDFDAPRVEGGQSIFHDDPRDDEHSVPLTEAILDDHPDFVDALARVLAEGHSLLFISGNHDAQMTLPGVRDVIRRRILDVAMRRSSEDREGLSKRLLFRAWFHLTAEGVLLEHGSQYDPYCSFHYPLDPHHRDTRRVQPTLGSLATRLMTSRMGYFNPHVDVTYELTGRQYVAHWLRYYIGSRHSLLLSWLGGSLRAFFHLAGARDPGTEARYHQNIEAAARETGLPKEKLKEHAALFAPPIELAELRRVARELWQDRLWFTLFSILWAALWLIFGPERFAAGALAGVAMFAIYEIVTPKIRVRDRWQKVDERAADVARVHGARAIVFGHTHHPHASWSGDMFIANAGSWSASFFDIECTQPVFPERPLVWLKADGDDLAGGLIAWTGTAFKPLVVREPAIAKRGSRSPAEDAGAERPQGRHFDQIEPMAP